MSGGSPLTETWLYAGQRVNDKGKTYHVWHDGTKLLNFGKLPGTVPGHAYAVEVSRLDGHVTVHGSPRYLAEQSTRQPTEIQLDEWRAEHAAARATVDGKRVEKAALADDELEAALETIRRHYDRLRTMGKRGAFINYVAGEMTRPPRKENER